MAFFKLPPLFKDIKPGSQFFLFLCFWVLFFVFFALVTFVLINKVFHLPPASAALSAEAISQYKWVQLISSVGIFLLPPLLLIGLFVEHPRKFLKLDRYPSVPSIAMVIMMLVFFVPVLNVLITWNEGLQLPDALGPVERIIRQMEDDAAELTRMFLHTDTVWELLFNLVLIALVPALGEELLFRGVFQQFLFRQVRNPHLAIWLAAFLFSLLHFQFYGIVPRMVLGALFGYLFFWSGSLWIPVFAHFLNNASAVMISYFIGDTLMEEELEHLGTNEGSWHFTLTGALLTVLVMWFFYQYHKKKPANRFAG